MYFSNGKDITLSELEFNEPAEESIEETGGKRSPHGKRTRKRIRGKKKTRKTGNKKNKNKKRVSRVNKKRRKRVKTRKNV